jgi:UDPglucose--hexose-1-phosphate uridylyltransferase
MPSMLWIHQRPTDGRAWPEAHVHIEVAVPMRAPGVPRYVAAMELGSGQYVNPVVPEQAASDLRAVEVRW